MKMTPWFSVETPPDANEVAIHHDNAACMPGDIEKEISSERNRQSNSLPAVQPARPRGPVMALGNVVADAAHPVKTSKVPLKTLCLDRIRILLADDHAESRRSLKIVVESDGDIDVVGEAKNGLEAVRMAKALRPQVVVMDMAMPLLNGLQATLEVRRISPSTRVIIFSAHSDPEYIKQAVAFGASGYLIKQSSTEALDQAIRDAVKGACAFSSSIPKRLRDEMSLLFLKVESARKKTPGRRDAA